MMPETGSRMPMLDTVRSSVMERISTGILHRWSQPTFGANTRLRSCQARRTIGDVSTSVGRARKTMTTSALTYSGCSNKR